MKKLKALAACTSLLSLLTACTTGQALENGPNYRQVGHVNWSKTTEIDPASLINSPVPQTTSRVIFLRDDAHAPVETSINVGVNDRFLKSLQPGNFARTLTCSGVNRLSAVITGQKTNDLLKNETAYNLDQGQTYYFLVGLNDSGNAVLTPITQGQGEAALAGKTLQEHQVNRAVPSCAGEQSPMIAKLDVYFKTNKADVASAYYPEIQRVAEFMHQYPSTVVRIEGHTDNHAPAAYNQNLSQRRADAVRNVLIQQFGISPDKLTAVGYGETHPIASNATDAGRQQNRRVIAVIQSR